MPAASETLPVLEERLAERLLAFERLDAAWPLSHFLRVVARRGSKYALVNRARRLRGPPQAAKPG